MKKINTIVIAVGGKGERIATDLKKVGFNSSKVLLKVDNVPILEHLINNAMEENFQRIFLLVSYYETELREFLNQKYGDNKKIIPIYGGVKRTALSVPFLFYSIKDELQDWFVYSDGNILYNSSLLHKMKLNNGKGRYLVNLALSSKDYAPTHSQVTKYRNRVYTIDTRLSSMVDDVNKTQHIKSYYSLGLITINPSIFSLIPEFDHKRDLDYVVKDIFDSNKHLVIGTVYTGPWISIHTIKDLERFSVKC